MLASSSSKVLIGSYGQPQLEFFDYGIRGDRGQKSSTSEMVFWFYYRSGNSEKLIQGVSECLYAGVMTDTGSFKI